MLRALRIHLGVLAVMTGSAYLLVRFTRLSTSILVAVPSLFFIYIGLFWIVTGAKRPRSDKRSTGDEL